MKATLEVAALAVLAVIIAVLLSACGGGDGEEETNDRLPPVNCQERPEACV